MCGIAGLFQLDHRPIAPHTLQAMADILRHRGPDDEGFALFNTTTGTAKHFKGKDSPEDIMLPDFHSADRQDEYDLGLAERRLAILDLTPAGHTPMTTPDGQLTVTFNGEIYNFVELREELVALGQTFRSTGDTEVLLTAYRQWGTECVTRFNGMWAFAIWEASAKRLFCSRDRFGVKPFYYLLEGGLFAFASEPKALWRSGLIDARPNQEALEEFLSGYEPSQQNESMFRGIHQLPAGHNLVVSPAGLRIERYWSMPCNPELGPARLETEPARKVRELLADAVRLRLRSDVPVGTCLSGGLDSSAIVCLANDLMRREHNISHQQIGARQKTFTACYDDPRSDESSFAQMIVEKTAAEWHKTFPTAESFSADLEKFLWHHDEPPITTSVYAQWCVMRSVREHGVIVTLDGQGSDELLAGYLPFDIYLSQILHRAKPLRFVKEARAVAKVGSRPFFDVLQRVTASHLPPAMQRAIQGRRNGRTLGLQEELSKRAFTRHQLSLGMDSRFNLPRHLAALTVNNLPRLLRTEDRNSMAFSVEARTPFLDVRFAEYVSQLPAAYRIHLGWSKYVLREAMREVLPEAVTWRRDKKGFVTPEAAWLELMRPRMVELFRDSPRTGPFLDLAVVRSVLEGKVSIPDPLAAASVWRWTAAELWLRMIEE